MYENGLTRVQDHCRKMCGNFLRTFLRTKWRVFFNVQENERFKVVNIFGFLFVRMVGSCFITNIRHFFSFMRRMRILGNYVDPHRRILSDAMQ